MKEKKNKEINQELPKKEKKRKKKYAHRVKTTGLQAVMAGIMPKRTEAEVWMQDKIDITELLTYLKEKNEGKEKHEQTTVFHCFITALTKLVHERPKLNYYVKRFRIYEREAISLAFVVKQKFTDHAKEELMFYVPKMEDNLASVSEHILSRVNVLREAKNGNGGVSGFFDTYAKLPRLFQWFLCTMARIGDYFQILPEGVKRGDSNFATILLSNLGSIKSPSVYHHLNNYGTNSIMFNIGLIHKEKVLMEDGSEQIRDFVDFGCTADERIADGFYFSKSLKMLKYIFANPKLLEDTIETPSGYEYK